MNRRTFFQSTTAALASLAFWRPKAAEAKGEPRCPQAVDPMCFTNTKSPFPGLSLYRCRMCKMMFPAQEVVRDTPRKRRGERGILALIECKCAGHGPRELLFFTPDQVKLVGYDGITWERSI